MNFSGWARAITKLPRRTFLVHGEEAAVLAFAETLRTQAGYEQVEVPAGTRALRLRDEPGPRNIQQGTE